MRDGIRCVKVKQGVEDLPKVYGDIDSIKNHLSLFGVSEVLDLIDPTKKRVDLLRKKAKMEIVASPETKFLVIFAIAGHGMQMDGRQIAVVNEFDKRTGHYKKWNVEHDIRLIAERNRNVYVMGLFACCREIFNAQRHTGYFGGTEL